MYNTPGLVKGLNFPKMIGGISKVLGIANQVIPIYLKAKPVIHNAKNILGVLKEMGKTSNNQENKIAKKDVENIKNSSNIKKEESNSPTFFL